MDRILNAIKCVICHEILESPVILPCNDIICKKHALNHSEEFIRCEKCGAGHQIPTNGFQPIIALQEIIESEIGQFDFGSVHKRAKKSCQTFEESLNELELILNDPHHFLHERISELKNIVQLKGEELKLKIDQEMRKLIDRLDEYERQSKEYLTSNECKIEVEKLENELKTAQSNLASWITALNKVKIDEEKWKSIIEESSREFKNLNSNMEMFKNRLLLNKFAENRRRVNCFKSIKIDSNLEYMSINKGFLISRIINESLSQKLEELLKKKNLNDQKWSLLYQASRDGFRASDFHSRCDGRPNTLTIIKSSESIFGGYTSAQWKSSGSWQYDKSAFIFSLENKESNPVIFDHTTSGNYAQYSIYFSSSYGPTFGGGYDFVIRDNSNTNSNSISNLGVTYTHPDYPNGSERARTILAGTYNFQVNEIEVYQVQQ